MSDLHALAVSAAKNDYDYDAPNPALLERFATPETGSGGLSLHIAAPEFTSLCPVTGQPDFAEIIIDYVPRAWCVESKSLKLYLMGFRQHGSFHEVIVCTIGRALVDLLDPESLVVRGEFTPRGGIPFWPTWEYVADDGA